MKLRELVASDQAFGRLLKVEMPPGIAFRLGMIARQISPYLEQFYKQRVEIARKYGTEADGNITIPNEHLDKYQEEISVLAEEEVPVNVTPIDPEVIGGKVTPEDMMLLYWLFKEGDK